MELGGDLVDCNCILLILANQIYEIRRRMNRAISLPEKKCIRTYWCKALQIVLAKEARLQHGTSLFLC